MKVGNLVKHVLAHERENMIGILLEKVHDPLAMNNDVFRVLWRDGKIGNNIWDYDLVTINES
jgi:hypothetical protein|tara:strand:- start:2390 stop:2575 length:186 start_codon:yes stop_codon:yes gene_type:complete